MQEQLERQRQIDPHHGRAAVSSDPAQADSFAIADDSSASSDDLSVLDFDDPFDERPAAHPQAEQGFLAKILGRTREQRWVRVLVVLIALLMTSIAIVMSAYVREGERLNHISMDSGLATVQLQRLERGLKDTVAGQPDAAAVLATHQKSVEEILASLDKVGESMLIDDGLPALQAQLGSAWAAAAAALKPWTAQTGGALQNRQLAQQAVVARLDQLNQSAAELLRAVSSARARNDLTLAAQIVLSTTRLQTGLNASRSPQAFDDATLSRGLAIFDDLKRRLPLFSGKPAVAASAVVRFDTDLAQARAAVVAYGETSPLIAKSRALSYSAQAALAKAQLALSALRQGLPGAQSTRSILPRIAGALTLLAALCALGLSRAYIWLGNTRAEQAEQQRAQAERLQEEARRTNDQNQAAILRLMNELQEVADGDLTVQATVSEDITGAIADSVNYTIEELRSLVSRINSTAGLVNEASTKAQHTSARLLAASAQQSREIRETGESVLRLATQIDDVSSQAAASVQVASQSQQASREGARAVDHAIAGMNMIRDQIQETAKRIKRLGESSQEIGDIVEMISGLSEQTNVLALNAAIQAASSGEAGRGFSVVAEEVQRLAERSAEATKQIAALIQTIQADTQDAVAAMERCTQGVVDGTRRSDEAGAALGQIGRVSSEIAQLIESFSVTTSEQAGSAATVADSIQRMLQVTEQTSQGTAETAGSVQKLSELALELKNSVSRFKVT